MRAHTMLAPLAILVACAATASATLAASAATAVPVVTPAGEGAPPVRLPRRLWHARIFAPLLARARLPRLAHWRGPRLTPRARRLQLRRR